MNRYLDLLDSPRVVSLDQLLENDDRDFNPEPLPLNERFRDETEDEAYFREAMELRESGRL